MCMPNSKLGVEKFLNKHKNHKTITAYKVVYITKKVYSSKDCKYVDIIPQVKPPYKPFKANGETYLYKVGENNSNARRRLCKKNRDIGPGLHVCLTESEAIYMRYGDRRIIKVKCNISDLIGVDKYGTRAVFKKFYISKTEYAKVIS